MKILRKSSARIILALIVYITFSQDLVAQITVDFHSSVRMGCTDFNATFNDLSVASGGIVYRSWDFGNGSISTGNNQSISHLYSQSGVYDVTLTVSNGYDTASITKVAYIEVLESPKAIFTPTGSIQGCAPHLMQFQNNSISGGAPILFYNWNFGDGTNSISSSAVSHYYQNSGTYFPSLIVTDTNGCRDTNMLSVPISVLPKPNAQISTVGPRGTCRKPLNVQFVNNSTGVPPLSYNWNLGNGTVTSIPAPSTAYTTNGVYPVIFTLQDGNGCRDTVSSANYITVGSIFADFNVPDTVCANEPIQLLNTSGGGASYSWSLGNGSSSTLENPVTSYSTGGVYSIALIIGAGPRCNDITSKQIYVEEVNADWSAAPTYACNPPLLVQYTDLSSGNITGYEWRFGKTSSSAITNSSNLQNPSFTFQSEGIYDDTLIVSSAFGCKDTAIQFADVEIHDIDVDFTNSAVKGCAPMAIQFTDISSPADSILSWHWNFGNGDSSIVQNPNYIFQNPGTYAVVLTVTDVSGCTHQHTRQVNIGSAQNALFTLSNSVYCASDTVTFTNLSNDTSFIDTYTWLMGDGGVSNDFNPSYSYNDTGWMNVTLIVENSGCYDSLTIDSAVYISGPVAQIAYQTDCNSLLDVQFSANLTGGTSFWWNFGDSSALNTALNPLHSYSSKGQYGVSFYAEDSISGCSVLLNESLYLRFPEAKLQLSDSLLCNPDTVFFDGSSSIDGNTYLWDFGDGGGVQIGGTNASYLYTTAGSYSVLYIVTDINNCSDSISKDLKLYNLEADFIGDTLNGCKNLMVDLTDLTSHDTTIISYSWEADNQLFSTVSNPTFNASQSPKLYDLTLMVTDALGCTDSISKLTYIKTTQPPSSFTPSSSDLCIGDTLFLNNVPIDPSYQYFFSFGDGNFSNNSNPVHVFALPGAYTVSLTVSDSNACDSTYSQLITVHDLPSLGIFANPTDTICYPANILFFDTVADPTVNSWKWDFGDGSNPITVNIPSVNHLYTNTGSFDVQLKVKSIYGCTSTSIIQAYINITGPDVSLSVDPDTLCLGQEALFTATSLNRTPLIQWDFGDGNIIFPSLDLNQTHTYAQDGVMNVIISYTDTNGNCPQVDTLSVFVDKVVADFTMSEFDGCEPFELNVANLSQGESDYEWRLNGMLIDTLFVPSDTISSSGLYDLELLVFNDSTLCRDTVSYPIEVHPKPFVWTSGDILICEGSSTVLSAAGGEEYVWNSSEPLLDASSAQITVSPTDTTVYHVDVTSDKGCIGSDSLTVFTMSPPVLQYISADTMVFLDQPHLLEAIVDMEVNSVWSPDSYIDCTTCLSTYISPPDSIEYTFTYGDTLGCFILDTTVYIAIDPGFKVTTPNSFTPNGDGLNDEFIPAYFGAGYLLHFGVYDRWGKEVFSTTDLAQGWDGTENGEPCERNRLYVYRIDVQSFSGIKHQEIGTVFLIGKQQR